MVRSGDRIRPLIIVVAKRLVDKVECYEIMVFEKLVSNFMLQK